MAEVLAEMATSAVGNPLADEQGGDENSEKVATPDFFATLRPLLMNERGENRLLVRLSPWMALLGSLSMVAYSLLVDKTPLGDTPIARVRFGVMGPVFAGASVFLPLLCNAIRAETGALAKLIDDGGGKGAKLMTEQQIRSLKRWRVLLAIPAAIIVLFGLTAPGPFMLSLTLAAAGIVDPDPGSNYELMLPMIPAFPPILFSLCVGYPMAIAWYFSMRVAVQLSQDEVVAVAKSATRETLSDDFEWTSKVAQPAIKLATGTMNHLSRGWGTGTGLTALMCAFASIGNFMGVVHDIRIGDTEDVPRRAAGCIGAAVAPFVIAADTAHVSTCCDRLMRAINDLRLEWASSEDAELVHRRTFPLQCTLERLNNGQGLGFTIFSKVVDKKTLNMIVFSVGSFYGTVIPLIMAFMPDPVSTSGESIQCLGAEEYAALGRVWLEGGCVALNDTIGTVLGGG